MRRVMERSNADPPVCARARAGKTTLMDCLAGRKTTGRIVGDVRVSGHPKVQETFARVAGYVEQSDIHSAHLTVLESLAFSARLRFTPDVRRDVVFAFVQEVRARALAPLGPWKDINENYLLAPSVHTADAYHWHHAYKLFCCSRLE